MKFTRLILLFISLNSFAQSTWQMVPTIAANPNGQRFDDVFFLNENLGWAANGFYASVSKTTDGGLTWTEQLNSAMLGGGYYFRNIEFLNANIGFLGTLNGTFFKTLDGGDTWNPVSLTPASGAICGIDAVGTSTIYACGAYFAPAHIIKSIDSGTTWQYIDMSAYATGLVEVNFLTETTGFAAGRNASGAIVLKTTDGGLTWTELYNSNIAGEYVWKLQVLDANTDVIFGSVETVSPNLGQLISTSDGGLNWNSYDAPEPIIQAVGFMTETHGWMGGHTTGFYETLDGGLNWTNLNVGNNLNRIFIINSTRAYASGTAVYKYTDQSLGLESFEDQSGESLAVEFLSNPVASHVEFSIHFKNPDHIVMELYDSNGRFIKQLLQKDILSKTSKTYKFPVESLASGLYFIDFHNNAGRRSKKFVKL